MITLSNTTSLSFVRAILPGNIVAQSINNNKVILQNITASQVLSSSSSEKISIQYDSKLIAPIFRG